MLSESRACVKVCDTDECVEVEAASTETTTMELRKNIR